MNKTIYCNNCGKRGHISKNCNIPITSYGVLLFTNDMIPKITMIQRKDSLCYIELIRGKYDVYDMKKIKLLLSRISKKELRNIKTQEFNTLWKNLWLLEDVNKTKYIKEYNNSKILFQKFKYDIEINEYLKNLQSKYDTSEWEFPKGKRNKGEKKCDSAKRELEEETNIDKEDYELIENMCPIIENFVGENNINYRNIYYIGICKNTENIKLNIKNKNQINEIKDVKLVTEDEAIKLIRDYNITKIDTIKYIFEFIKKYNNDFIINK
jgi:8-oxo-dGTP pyrophosphatase MutT (NUDIX family)